MTRPLLVISKASMLSKNLISHKRNSFIMLAWICQVSRGIFHILVLVRFLIRLWV